MQFLVSALWIDGEAADRNLTATPSGGRATVQADEGPVLPDREGLQAVPKTSGQSEEDILSESGSTCCRTRSDGDHRDTANVDDGAIEDYYKQNEAQFSQPERRDLRVVLAEKEDEAKEAKQRVKGGEKFSKVAKELSEDPATKNQGGRLLGITKGQQETELRQGAVRGPREGRRADQDRRGLLRLRGHEDHAGDQADPGAVQGGHPPAADLAEAAAGAGQVHDQLPQQVASADRLREGLAIPDCSNGGSRPRPRRRAARPEAAGPRPTGAAPPALDGTGSNARRRHGGGTVLGSSRRPPAARRQRPARRSRRRSQRSARAGRRPKKGAAGALPGGVPPGVGAARRRRRRSGPQQGAPSRAAPGGAASGPP